MGNVISSQVQSGWESNVYVVTMIRILLVVGASFLTRSVYHFYQRFISSNSFSPYSGAEENIGLELDDVVSGTVATLDMIGEFASDASSIDTDVVLGVRLPERSYIPQTRQERTLSYLAMERQRLNATFASSFAISTPTPRINLNDGDDIAEEGTEASADLAI